VNLAGGLSHETTRWSLCGAGVFIAHAAIVTLAVAWVRTPAIELQPPVLVELPPIGVAEAPANPSPSQSPPLSSVLPQSATHVEVPLPRAPLPQDAIRLPPPSTARPPAVQPATASLAVAVHSTDAPAPARAGTDAGVVGVDDPRARKLEADYKSLVGSHIRRNRFSPPQSRKAGLSGDVKVRFKVDRGGGIGDVGIAQSSGHSLLDEEAVRFIQRLSPVPAFPRDLRKAEIPLTITLKFALESK
jgi:protein TonB